MGQVGKGPRVKQERAEVQSSVAESTEREGRRQEREVHFLSWSSWAVTAHPPLVLTAGHHSSPESHPRGGSHELGLYNLPVTEQLEPKASEDESGKQDQEIPSLLETGPPPERGKGRAGRLCAAEDSLDPTWVPRSLVLCGGGRYLAC